MPSSPTRRDFLRAGTAAVAVPGLAQAAGNRPEPRAKSVILVFLGGGLSHLDTFDPKPDAPAEIRGPYRGIPTSVPGVRLGERLPQLARRMHRVALIRSLTHASDHHETASNWVLSGRNGGPFGAHPAVGAVVAHALGDRAGMPAHVALPRNPAFTWELGTAAYLGQRYEAVPSAAVGEGSDVLSLGGRMRAACRLVEAGTRFVTVTAGGWDHHTDLFGALDRKLPEFDAALAGLIDELHDRGTASETLVAVLSEFGRSPRINTCGGRDHWPAAGSALLFGAGAAPGAVIGSTDRHGAEVTERPVSPGDVAATLLGSLGIAGEGRLVRELWA